MFFRKMMSAAAVCAAFLTSMPSWADSVNSPNVTLNVDTNRSTGNGAGNVALTINTITIAEITLPEYSSGTGKAFTIQAKPGYQFDASSPVTAQSSTIGFNGGGINVAASVVPTGAADEALTFNLTSGTDAAVQDIIRVNGIKLKILDARGAAGPAQTTMTLTTSTMGGAFTGQGMVAANIQKGKADHLNFAVQPGDSQSGTDLLPSVSVTDFGNNLLLDAATNVTLVIQNNPGPGTLSGDFDQAVAAGIAVWLDDDNLNIATAGSGYTLRASHDGSPFLNGDTVDSDPFDVTAGAPNHMVISKQPVNTPAGDDILVNVTVLDAADNPVSGVAVTLDAAINPGGWPLLVDTSLTKTTVGGVASWGAADHLRITAATDDYKLVASGAGAPVQTDAFDIVAGDPALLVFEQQPTDTEAGEDIDPQVTVEIVDAFGNRTNGTDTVTLTQNEECGTLSGATATAVGGLASFPGLTVGAACEGNVLNASVDGLVGAASNPFDVAAPSAGGNGGNGGGCSLVR